MEELKEKIACQIYHERNGSGAKPWSLLPKSHKVPYLLDAVAAFSIIKNEGFVVTKRPLNLEEPRG